MPQSGAELWTVAEAAEYLRLPLSSLYKMTAAKSTNPIPHIKLGGRLRFRKADIDAWLDLWTVEPAALPQAKARALALRGGRTAAAGRGSGSRRVPSERRNV